MLGEERLAEPWHALRPGQVRPADEPAQAAIADLVAGEQDEVRATLALADAAQVLSDGVPMTGQPGPLRTRPDRRAARPAARSGGPASGTAPQVAGDGRRPSAADRPPTGHHDPVRVRTERVEQLELQPDDRVQPGLAGRGREPDDPVETLVIGDRERRQPELDRPLDELIGGRGAIQEREVRVAVELGVGARDGRSAGHLGFPLDNGSGAVR